MDEIREYNDEKSFFRKREKNKQRYVMIEVSRLESPSGQRHFVYYSYKKKSPSDDGDRIICGGTEIEGDWPTIFFCGQILSGNRDKECYLKRPRDGQIVSQFVGNQLNIIKETHNSDLEKSLNPAEN